MVFGSVGSLGYSHCSRLWTFQCLSVTLTAQDCGLSSVSLLLSLLKTVDFPVSLCYSHCSRLWTFQCLSVTLTAQDCGLSSVSLLLSLLKTVDFPVSLCYSHCSRLWTFQCLSVTLTAQDCGLSSVSLLLSLLKTVDFPVSLCYSHCSRLSSMASSRRARPCRQQPRQRRQRQDLLGRKFATLLLINSLLAARLYYAHIMLEYGVFTGCGHARLES